MSEQQNKFTRKVTIARIKQKKTGSLMVMRTLCWLSSHLVNTYGNF